MNHYQCLMVSFILLIDLIIMIGPSFIRHLVLDDTIDNGSMLNDHLIDEMDNAVIGIE